ncbi:hypothetical protein JCM10213_000663 [Rhodosporidiobolus nylandii]
MSSTKSIHLSNLVDIRFATSSAANVRTVVRPSNWRDGLYRLSRRNPIVAVLHWWLAFLANTAWTLFFAPNTLVADPVGSLAAAALYPIIGFGLTLYAVLLFLYRLAGGTGLTEWLGDRWGMGRSVPNWANPRILMTENDVILTEARPVLRGEVATTVVPTVPDDADNYDFTSLATTRLFSVPLARALLLCSAAVYERDDKLVEDASDIAYNATKELEAGRITQQRFGELMQAAQTTLAASEEPVRVLARSWNLDYDGVSDLSTIGGPFASLFFTRIGKEAPFIILAFKGTTPDNLAEWITDFSFSRVPAGSFFGGGTAHKGFFSTLFKTDARRSGGDGYGSIVAAIKHVARRLNDGRPENERRPIPLWVTGHSLGSAEGLLCFARFLESPDDFVDHEHGGRVDVEVKDFYGFGTLRVGDGAFVSAFEHSTTSPIHRPNIAWRVQQRVDIATTLPLGFSDSPKFRSVVSPASFLNFGHPGPAIVLRPVFAPLGNTYRLDRLGAFNGATAVKVVIDQRGQKHVPPTERRQSGDFSAKVAAICEEPQNLLRWLAALVPAPVYDHAPWSYYHALSNIGFSSPSLTRVAAGDRTIPAALDLSRSTAAALRTGIVVEPVGGIEYIESSPTGGQRSPLASGSGARTYGPIEEEEELETEIQAAFEPQLELDDDEKQKPAPSYPLTPPPTAPLAQARGQEKMKQKEARTVRQDGEKEPEPEQEGGEQDGSSASRGGDKGEDDEPFPQDVF